MKNKYIYLVFIVSIILSTIANHQAQSPFKINYSQKRDASLGMKITWDHEFFVDGNDICLIDAYGSKTLKNAYIARFDKTTLNLISYSSLIPKDAIDKSFMKMVFSGIMPIKDKNFILIQYFDRKLKKSTYYKLGLDQTFIPISQPEKIFEIDQGNRYSWYKFYYSDETNQYILLSNLMATDAKHTISYATYDSEFNAINKANIKFDEGLKNNFFSSTSGLSAETSLGPENLLYGINVQSIGNVYKPQYKIYVLLVDLNTTEYVSMVIDQVENPVSGSCYADKDNFYVFGYFRSGKVDNMDGLYVKSISRKNMNVTDEKEYLFDEKITTSMNYTKSDSKFFGGKILEIFKTSDNGWYVVGEQDESSSVFSQSGSYTIYRRGNILVTKLDSVGKLEWTSTIPRRTFSKAHQFVACKCYLVKDQLVFFYNDNPDNIDKYNINDLKIGYISSQSGETQLVGAVMDPKGNYKKYGLARQSKDNGFFAQPKDIYPYGTSINKWIGRVFFDDFKTVGLVEISM